MGWALCAAVAGSLGGVDAPQAERGLQEVLKILQKSFSSKYAIQSLSNASEKSNDALRLLFPGGVEDPGYCNIMRDYISLMYAVGVFPLDENAGYGLPGNFFNEGIVSSLQEDVSISNETMDHQLQALSSYLEGGSVLLDRLWNSTTQMAFIR